MLMIDSWLMLAALVMEMFNDLANMVSYQLMVQNQLINESFKLTDNALSI